MRFIFGIGTSAGPRKRHHPSDESVDQAPKLIEAEATEIEEERPAEANESLQQNDDAESDLSAFQEE